ncbi:NACHT domain-containing protein [Streptomyces sp. NPDC050844]|uniref:NACHT domain-containing protein n=1 Tax=Streptomyces sp. NPDC050844 TaxID=3155790 RepID=UPI003404CB0E
MSGTKDEQEAIVALFALLVSALAAVVTPLLTRYLGAPSESVETRLPRAAEALTIAVREQWKAEARLRRLQDPAPLDVRWARGDGRLADHPANLRHNVAFGPAEIGGSVDQLVAAFVDNPDRRVVVLGSPGSGKSVLAVRFALGYLDARPDTAPIPVVFPLSTWDAQYDSLTDWLVHRLATDYEALGLHVSGAETARELLARGRILLVLDGFDELPQPVRPTALRRLNAELDQDAAVLLTSRAREYAETVGCTDVLTTATVLELRPVGLDEACTYLSATAPPRQRSGPVCETAWSPVVDCLRTAPEGSPAAALRTVLSAPLMVAMARAVTEDSRNNPDRHPTRLLAPRFGQPEAIEEHLLDGYVPAVYAVGGTRPQDAELARHRLTFLARHVRREGDGAIAWWRLEAELPGSVRHLGPALLSVLLSWPVLALLYVCLPHGPHDAYGRYWDTGDPSSFLLVKLPWIVAFAVGTALLTQPRLPGSARDGKRFVRRRRALVILVSLAASGFATWLGGQGCEQFWVRLNQATGGQSWRSLTMQEIYQIALGFTVAALFGFQGLRRTPGPAMVPTLAAWRRTARAQVPTLLGGIVTGAGAGTSLFCLGLRADGLFNAPDVPLWHAVVSGAVVGGFVGAVAVVVGLVHHTPIDPADRPLVLTPRRSLLQDRSATLARSVLLSALSSVLLLSGQLPVRAGGNIPGLAGQLWLTVGPTALALSPWGRFLIVRVWCAATGRLPWRIMAFLEDAHVRGVFRQVGAVHQFRHIRLQERLTLPVPAQQTRGSGSGLLPPEE